MFNSVGFSLRFLRPLFKPWGLNECMDFLLIDPMSPRVFPTNTSSEFVYELNENKGQFARIRYENGKFHSNSVLILLYYKYNQQIHHSDIVPNSVISCSILNADF